MISNRVRLCQMLDGAMMRPVFLSRSAAGRANGRYLSERQRVSLEKRQADATAEIEEAVRRYLDALGVTYEWPGPDAQVSMETLRGFDAWRAEQADAAFERAWKRKRKSKEDES